MGAARAHPPEHRHAASLGAANYHRAGRGEEEAGQLHPCFVRDHGLDGGQVKVPDLQAPAARG